MTHLKTAISVLVIAAASAVALASIGGEEVRPVVAISIAVETRCGWFYNPTPSNAWLTDKDGEWTISIQGGYQAEGDWPAFKGSQWVKTNINYGYGCACIKATTNKTDMKVVEIKSSTTKPLSVCRKDKALKGNEPKD